MAQRRYRIFEKAQSMEDWPDAVVPYIEKARSEAAREFADNLSGWRRRGLANIATRELKRGAFASAAAVLLSGFAPVKLRSIFGGSEETRPGTQITATIERPSGNS
jgi:hypothetical protein